MAENNLLAAIKIPKYPPQSIFPSDVLKWMKCNAVAYPRQALKPFTDNNEKWYIKRLNDEWENEMEFNELPKNIWLTNSFVVDKLNYIPQLLPKITVFDIKELALTSIDCQTLRLSDLKILTSNGFNKILRFFLHKIIILDTNDEIVPLVDVLELVPNVTYLIL
uniref:Uncharacterized protein n=1 Tax=Panagrolaimus superbus TaxID=310955 RepID=A0A914YTI6_9BILA